VQGIEDVRREVEQGFTPEDEKNLDDLGI